MTPTENKVKAVW